MRNLFPISGFSVLLIGAMSIVEPAPAAADNVATRCSSYGCEAIRCNYTGDRCYRIDGFRRDAYESSWYGEDYGRSYYDEPYYERIGYGGRLVCDSDGDRCYRSDSPFWNYREYYRRHGYHWTNEAYVPPYRGDAYVYRSRFSREAYYPAYDGYGYDRAYDDGDFDWRR